MKRKILAILLLIVFVFLVFLASQFIPGFKHEALQSFYERQIDHLISSYEGSAFGSNGPQSRQEYEARISPASAYWKAKFLRNKKNALVAELIKSRRGIDPRQVQHYLDERYFESLESDPETMSASTESGNPATDGPVTEFYEDQIDKYTSIYLLNASLLKDSRFEDIRASADRAFKKALFLKTNKNLLVQEMMAQKIGEKNYAIETYLSNRFHENRQKNDHDTDLTAAIGE